jgi:hypothetical protein
MKQTLNPVNQLDINEIKEDVPTTNELGTSLPIAKESFYQKNKNLIVISVAVVAAVLLYKKFGK